jgi:aryl-alcohol dehydrogenase-like predicted oxidoreductase
MPQGIAVMPWRPLARGRLTRAWDESSERQETDEFGKGLYKNSIESDQRIVEQVAQIADARGVSRAQVALGLAVATTWHIGADRRRLEAASPHGSRRRAEAVAALKLNLTGDEVTRLEGPYVPHAVVGFK